ncbi:MAG: beta-lactamase class D [bacterium]|jgi:beta-lactamase class D
MNTTGLKVSTLAIFILVCFFGCKSNKEPVKEVSPADNEMIDSLPQLDTNHLVVDKFQMILDNYNLEGSVLFFNAANGKWLSNDFDWAEKRRLPASTFKVVNSIIGMETGKVKTGKTEFIWDGEKRSMKQWERDFDLKGAFHASCVPCYQDLAKRIGVKNMKMYLDTFNYGRMIVDSESLDVFWLEGESGVSQFEQIAFFEQFYNNKLPIKLRTTKEMKSLMVIDKNDGYTLSGKTGWSIRNGNNNGWFVGYIEKDNTLFYFATNVSPGERFKMELFPRVRSEVTLLACKVLQSYSYE